MGAFRLASGNWVCSIHDVWMPGIYETRRACQIALQKDRFSLLLHWARRPNFAPMTEAELQELPDMGEPA